MCTHCKGDARRCCSQSHGCNCIRLRRGKREKAKGGLLLERCEQEKGCIIRNSKRLQEAESDLKTKTELKKKKKKKDATEQVRK